MCWKIIKGKRRGDGERQIPSHHNSSSHIGSYLPIPWRHQLFAALLQTERRRGGRNRFKKRDGDKKCELTHTYTLLTQNGEHVLLEAKGCWAYRGALWAHILKYTAAQKHLGSTLDYSWLPANTRVMSQNSRHLLPKLHWMHSMTFKGVLHILSAPICRKIVTRETFLQHDAEIFECAVTLRKGCDILFLQRWCLLVMW